MSENKKVSVFTMIGAFVGAITAVVAAKLATDPEARKKLQGKFEDFKKQMSPGAEQAKKEAAMLESAAEKKLDEALEKAKGAVEDVMKKPEVKKAVRTVRKTVKKASSKK